MEKRKLTIKEKIALVVIAVLMVATIAVGVVLIVGNTNKAQEELLNTEHTTVEIITQPETEAETNADSTERKANNNTENKTESKTTSSKTNSSVEKSTKSSSSTKSNTKSNTKSSTKSTVSNSKTTSKSKNGALVPEKIRPTVNETHASDNICTVNEKKCFVGDTITMTLNLKTPVVLVNYQGLTEFDNDYLEFIDTEMNSGGICNEKNGVIYYNASILNGIDFTEDGTVYTATFKVKKAGSTEIKNHFQILTDMNDKAVSPSNCRQEIKVYD
ncbi:MAG: hypothetical protein J1E96_05220 [Ruminococcus sp.]|nr:hypothetical protein [Ruminococcus sp.]